MSLIADSLKKALKSKEPARASRPEFNLIGKAKGASKSAGTQNILRFIILIVIPGTLLAYLIHEGAFDKNRRFNIKDLSIWETLGFKKKRQIARAPAPKPAPPAPVKPAPKPAAADPREAGKRTGAVCSS